MSNRVDTSWTHKTPKTTSFCFEQLSKNTWVVQNKKNEDAEIAFWVNEFKILLGGFYIVLKALKFMLKNELILKKKYTEIINIRLFTEVFTLRFEVVFGLCDCNASCSLISFNKIALIKWRTLILNKKKNQFSIVTLSNQLKKIFLE